MTSPTTPQPPTPTPPYSFADLLAIMERLRAPGGCPWDREQTHLTLLPYLVEESYEFIEAAERGDAPHMREELGDVLLQVVFHAQVAKEGGSFDIDGVIGDIAAKLIRRHPHVFGEATADTADAVVTQWDAIKKAEKKSAGAEERKSVLDGIPRGLPALPKALKISERAVKVGFEWPDWKGVSEKVREELAEFEVEASALDALDKEKDASAKEALRDAMELELGDLLFAVVNLGRRVGLDAERALSRSNAKFTARWRAMEAMAEEEGAPRQGPAVENHEARWPRAKKSEG
jgi:tetrapyrrole methylase family protein/MazG family protein